jgi:hypothetical protein
LAHSHANPRAKRAVFFRMCGARWAVGATARKQRSSKA